MDPARFGRNDVSLVLLALLSDHEQYGYEIVAELRRRSDGVFDLPEGTVYPALRRLERQGLLRARWVDVPDAPRRRYYALTQAGERVLADGRDAWRQFVAATDAVLG
jgi:PadR family transcriptional regulator, regulatory protein PadR